MQVMKKNKKSSSPRLDDMNINLRRARTEEESKKENPK